MIRGNTYHPVVVRRPRPRDLRFGRIAPVIRVNRSTLEKSKGEKIRDEGDAGQKCQDP
jgi:hypothetical protein